MGLGQCSSVIPFMKDWLLKIEYDEIIFCDTGKEAPMTYEHLRVMEKFFDITVLKTETKYPHPPLCTKHAKVEPTRRYLRSKGINKAIKYLGITWEEKSRVRENGVKWIKNNYPLVEQKMTRKDCQEYLLKKLGYVPPRSGCIDCKYHTSPFLDTGRLLESELTISRSI